MRITRTDANGERRRHNGYGVDVIGGPANLDMAFVALNAHGALLAAAQAAQEAISDEVQAYLDHDMAERAEAWMPALRALEAAIAKAKGG
jgi:hypothetical protein